MRKATFIITTLVATLYLTGCGHENNAELEALQERVNSIESQLESSSTSNTAEPDAESTETIKQEVSTPNLLISSTSLEIPQISKENEDINVTMLYCGNTFGCKVSSESKLEYYSALDLPYYGSEVRYVSLIISGVTVNGIYKVDTDTLKQIEVISYDNVDNTYLTYLYIDGNNPNLFMIQTVNGSHYYVAIKY